MNTTIVGQGAVGSLIGGLLSVGGHDVTFVGKSGTPEKPKKGAKASRPSHPSLRVILPSEWLLAEGITHSGPEDGRKGTEVWIVTLARHHLHALRRPDFQRITAGGEGPVYFFNCDPAEPDRLALSPERRRFGLSLFTAVKLQEGEAELASADPALVVEKGPETEELFRAFRHHGFRILAVDDIAPYMSSFFIFQLLFLPLALCNLTLPAFLSSADGRDLARNILNEGFLTMDKLSQPLAPLPAMDPRELAVRIDKKPSSFDSARTMPDRSYNSVLQAYLKDRQVEAAFLNRRLVEMASSAGLHLTWNWRLMQKLGRVSQVGFYRDPSDLLRSLG